MTQNDPLVLVVEDDPDVRALLALNVRIHGVGVLEAANGEEALRILSTERLDLVLLDIMMPDVDGWTVLQELRAWGDDVAVVLITALDRVGDLQRAWELGVGLYITKPFDSDEIHQILQGAFSKVARTTKRTRTPRW